MILTPASLLNVPAASSAMLVVQSMIAYASHPLLVLIHTASIWDSILEFLKQALSDYGYIIVFLAIMIESMGVPFPGETMLLIASAYTASTGVLSIFGVIASAAGGAIVGDNIGYWIGREGGRRLIRKFGKYVGLTEDRYARAQD